jgi:hypothetical protein
MPSSPDFRPAVRRKIILSTSCRPCLAADEPTLFIQLSQEHKTVIASNLLWKRSAGKCNPITAAVMLFGAAVAAPASASNIHNVEFGFGLQYDTGGSTSLGFNSNHQLVEVHQSQSTSTLWYSVGYTNRAGTYWGSTGIQYDNGITPKCALNDSGVVVEVHQSQGNTSPRRQTPCGTASDPSTGPRSPGALRSTTPME